jgi:pimeloyl-ACP methyl ester carboxylesterase
VRRLVFLPGALADQALWQPLAALLPAEWHKTFVTWPGIGSEPPDPAVRSFADLIARAERALPAEPVDLFGQSLGGEIACHLVVRHPQRVRRLVLSATLGATRDPPPPRTAAPGSIDWRDGRANLTAALARMAVPTLLLFGEQDRLTPPAAGEMLRDLLPDAQLHTIAGAAHEVARTHAAELVPLVESHLA